MADDSQRINQDEIERLLQQARSPDPDPLPAAAAPPPSAPPVSSPAADESFAKILGQSDVEALFQQQQAASSPKAGSRSAASAVAGRDEGVAQADIELLLQQAERAIASIDRPEDDAPPGVAAFQLEDFVGAAPNTERATLDLIRDVELDLKIEFGRTHMYLEDILRLRKGSVVPLDKLAGDPVDIFVNGRLIAKGEVLVLNDNFCVRVAELIAGETAG